MDSWWKKTVPFHELNALPMALQGQIETAKPGNEKWNHIHIKILLGQLNCRLE